MSGPELRHTVNETTSPTPPRRIARIWLVLAGLAVAALLAWALTRGDRTAGGGVADGAATATPATAAPDSVVTLDTAAARLAGLNSQVVSVDSGGALVANGSITYNGNRVSVIASRAEGRVVEVRTDLGRSVKVNDILAWVESPEVGQAQGERQRTTAAVDIARRNYEREKRLYDQAITSQKELLDAENEYRTAQADFAGTMSRLRALGVLGVAANGRFGLRTPIAGTVVERHATPGQIIGPETDLFTVADLRHVWITVDIYEKDFGRVQNGATAQVIPSALPADTFLGRVTFAGGVVDSASRTVKVRVEVENESQRIRPGMFAQVRIATPRRSGPSQITVPETAVQDIAGRPTVFVATGVPGQFVARAVTVGPRPGGGVVAVTDGLKAGERVAVGGAFQLKAELTKSTFGEAD